MNQEQDGFGMDMPSGVAGCDSGGGRQQGCWLLQMVSSMNTQRRPLAVMLVAVAWVTLGLWSKKDGR